MASGSGRPAKPHNVVHCLFEVLIATSKSPVSIRSFQRLPMLSIYGVIRKLSPSNCIGSHTPVKPEILDQNPSRHYRATKQRYQRLIVRFGHVSSCPLSSAELVYQPAKLLCNGQSNWYNLLDLATL